MNDVVVISGRSVTFRVRVLSSEPLSFDAITVKEYSPNLVPVPEIMPDVLNFMPSGSELPSARLQVMGYSPEADSAAVYELFRIAAGRDDVTIDGGVPSSPPTMVNAFRGALALYSLPFVHDEPL